MPSQTDHYIEAERLLAEGVSIVNRISKLADQRREAVINRAPITAQMDELGKKAMGIWAQAQVHATLAHVPDSHVGALLLTLGGGDE